MSLKRNRLEINGFKFNKTTATGEAERIIRERQSRVNAARKPYRNTVEAHENAEKQLQNMIKESASLALEETSEEIERQRKSLLSEITVQEINVRKCFAAIEPARLQKQRDMRKCAPAWKLQPVECIGKRGGNYVFLSGVAKKEVKKQPKE